MLLPFQIGFQIKTRVQELGHGCIFLVQKAGALQITPSDSFTKRELIECARTVTEKVSVPVGPVTLLSQCRQDESVERLVNYHADASDGSTQDEVVRSYRGRTTGGRLTVDFQVKKSTANTFSEADSSHRYLYLGKRTAS